MSQQLIKQPRRSGKASRQTQALQKVFDEKLAVALLWRMHNLNRFSSADSTMRGRNLQMWDLITCDFLENDKYGYGIITAIQFYNCSGSRFDQAQCLVLNKPYSGMVGIESGQHQAVYIEDNLTLRTIKPHEVPAFKQALEVANAPVI